METNSCPRDAQLLPVVAGEPLDDQTAEHVAACDSCRMRISSLRSEIDCIRRLAADDGSAGSSRDGDTVPMCRDVPREFSQRLLSAVCPAALPSHIGPYSVKSILKCSGQAVVYRGWHPSLRIDVVIKWEHETIASRGLDESRVATEGRKLAQVRHPNLVRVYDLGVHEGRPFLVLEYIAGDTLRVYAAEHSVDPEAAAHMVEKLALAVDAAHRCGFLHLDLKPDNVVMDPGGEPKLIDFGASLLERRGPADKDSSRTVAIGTPQYMAPEQLGGEPDRLTERTDVYGLGAVLYELLTGSPPRRAVRRRTSCAGTLPRENMKLLSTSGAPRDLQRICRQALASDSDGRYGSAGEVAAALRRFRWRKSRRMILAILGLMLFFNLSIVAVPLPEVMISTRHKLEAEIVLPDGRLVPLPTGLPLQFGESVQFAADAPPDRNVLICVLTDEGRAVPILPLERERRRDRVRFTTAACRIRDAGSAAMPVLVFTMRNLGDSIETSEPVLPNWTTPELRSLPATVMVRFNAEAVELSQTPDAGAAADFDEAAIRREITPIRAALARLDRGFEAVLLPTPTRETSNVVRITE